MIRHLLKRSVRYLHQNSRWSFSYKEVYDLRQPENLRGRQKQLEESTINCLVLHPVFYPNKGPNMELYFAEEAVGLAKSLNWKVIKGPYWKEDFDNQIKIDLMQREQVHSEDERKLQEVITPVESTSENKSKGKRKRYKKKSLNKNQNDSNEKEPASNQSAPIQQSQTQLEKEGWQTLGSSNIKDGEYIFTPYFKGTYYKGGLIIDFSSDSDDPDLFNEWKNQILRQSIAKSSLMKIRNVISKHFFTKGKLLELGEFIKQNNVDAVFINSELTPLQSRNLERHWSNIVNGQPDKVFFKRNPQLPSETESEVEGDFEIQSQSQTNKKSIKVFDRFTIILQIFAKRAKTSVAKLQIQLCFLNYLKTKLVRSGGSTFSSMFNIFAGDLMSAQEIRLEVVSAKARGSRGAIQGSGETELEIQKRFIGEKEAKLKKELQIAQEQRNYNRSKRKQQQSTTPSIALIGYTNAGKSAIMNTIMKGEVVESKDMLFQTLNTTARKINLVSGQRAILLDTVGFITNLPHELIESFKSTLEEVEHADLVLHVRDISHPHTEQQKQIVLKILRELKFDQSFYTKKMIEVWNKIDLLQEPIKYDEIQNTDYPIVPISAVYKMNIDKLLKTMETKINELKGKKIYSFQHSLDVHGDRMKWLYQYANVTSLESEEYNYDKSNQFPYGSVKIQVLLDETSARRFMLQFQIIDRAQNKRGLPPKEWIQGSQSFFEKKRKEKEQQDQKKKPQDTDNYNDA